VPSIILDYHERTKHSPASVQSSRHFLDWEIQPRPFKLYRGLEPILLPRQLAPSSASALEALAKPPAAVDRFVPDRLALARLLQFSAGITRTKTYGSGLEMHFRAAACTGALYHIDLYLVCGDLPDLEAGVYHFGPHDFALRRLRGGDFRSAVVEATAAEPSVVTAPALLVCTSTFWRNSWKYQARTYRHCFWDAGTLLANLLAVAAAQNAPARVVLGFVDSAINRLLGLDAEREVALAIVPIGRTVEGVTPMPPAIEPLAVETEPLSEREVDYPLIRAAHAATSFERREQVESWRRAEWRSDFATPAGASIPLSPLADPPDAALERTILRRGSSREFARRSIPFATLSTILEKATAAVPLDCLADGRSSLNELYLIVNGVEGLEAGAYAFRPGARSLEVLRKGDFRRQAEFLDLGQALAGDASVDLYLLSDIRSVVKAFGDRGYRAAQLEAAILGGRIYLATYALGLGATGLTFFDDAVTDFFSPHAAGKGVMFLVAVGKPEKR
jgi:SagB-type dehydrogenase family enzyme